MRSIEGENTQKHFNAISFKIDLKIEIDENRHSNKNIKIKRNKNKNLVASLLELILTKKILIF